MPTPFRTTRRVEFCDTDAAGIVHFSRFFIYMETAEHELLRSVGLSVMQAEGDSHLSWPRVSANCNYTRPAKFEDLLTLEVSIARLGEKSVTFQHRFLLADQLLATGSMTNVCCRMTVGQPPQSLPIPAPIREKLAPFVVGT